MLWRDANHNGLSDNDELEFLRDIGIVSISFVPFEIPEDEKVEERADVTLVQNGFIKEAYINEFWFDVDFFDKIQYGKITVCVVLTYSHF